MATIQITGWKKAYVGFTGWDSHARSEFKKRLRRAVFTSPKQRRYLAFAVYSRTPVIFEDIREQYLESLRQILETMGAEVVVSMATASSSSSVNGVDNE